METINIFYQYLLRVTPSLSLLLFTFFILKPDRKIRVIIYLFLFVLLRDTLTPLKLWFLGNEAFLWIRLNDNKLFLILFGVFSLFIMLGIIKFDKGNKKYIDYFLNKKSIGLLLGIAGSFLITLPFVIIYQFTDIQNRGGEVSKDLLIPIFIFAMFGNFFEEGLFRGYVLGYLKEKYPPIKSGIISGVIFSICHIYLATTITNIGISLLIFTLWEGIIAGIIGSKYGIIPATIAHGGAIFILTSGIV